MGRVELELDFLIFARFKTDHNLINVCIFVGLIEREIDP